jgi:hypothetical protein
MGPCYYKPDAANAVSMKIGLPSKSSIPIAVTPVLNGPRMQVCVVQGQGFVIPLQVRHSKMPEMFDGYRLGRTIAQEMAKPLRLAD